MNAFKLFKKMMISILTGAVPSDFVCSGKLKVAILATGGTIVSRGGDALSLTEYGSGIGSTPLGIQTLLDAVPEIHRFAEVSGEQVFNIGSSKLAIEDLLVLSKRINVLLASGAVDGVVVTHGTDTLEETAYFLNLTVKSDKPVVLTASMRPATGLSADGPLNLVNAVGLAAHPSARDKGVLVLMNDRISSAFGVTKKNTTNVAAFQCPDTGDLGVMQNSIPYFSSVPMKRHTHRSEFDISTLEALPRVEINYTSLGSDGLLIDAAVRIGARGIVNAGVGHSNMSVSTWESLVRARSEGVAVVAASRTGSGMVTLTQRMSESEFVAAMMHSPQKSRILLMLALTRTDETGEIQRIFNEY